MRVAVVTTEPTPYRAPQLDRLARHPDLDLTVFYAASTFQRRTWKVELDHPHEILRGVTLPLNRVLLHDYPLTPAIRGRLARGRYDCVVIWGWSTFASQLAVAWCRLHGTPYLVFAESQLTEPRPAWVRLIKRLLVPLVVGPAAGQLVTGTRAREHALAYGAQPDRIWTFANTVDTLALRAEAERLHERRDPIRSTFGIEDDRVVVAHVARQIPQKGTDVLIAAVARTRSRPLLLVVGDGPQRQELERLAASSGVDAVFTGELGRDRLVEAYVAGDVFAQLSRKEPWGVVVNEAAACGLPLVLSDRVGAAADLVEAGENGFVIPSDDPSAAAAALDSLAKDADLRSRMGARSAELAAAWGYEPSEAAFVAACRAAVSSNQSR